MQQRVKLILMLSNGRQISISKIVRKRSKKELSKGGKSMQDKKMQMIRNK